MTAHKMNRVVKGGVPPQRLYPRAPIRVMKPDRMDRIDTERW